MTRKKITEKNRELLAFIRAHKKIMVITGAGISSHSGIPTYRDNSGHWTHRQPIQHQAFIDNITQRQRYWSRSAIGWPHIEQAQPNSAHMALVKLESAGKINCVVTQNVDRLHQQAGHKNVIDLHGRLDQVICLACGLMEKRATVQQRIIDQNPFVTDQASLLAPDGDADIPDKDIDKISCPVCQACNGMLMPDVVFFGGTVPKTRVDSALQALQAADALLIIGSSLMVYSGFRFCKAAKEWAMPIAAINNGKTRADDLFQLKIEEDCCDVLCYLEKNT